MSFFSKGYTIKWIVVLAVNILFIAGIAVGQTFTDDAKIAAGFLKSFDSLSAKGGSISAEEVQKALIAERSGVTLDLVKPASKELAAHTLYEKVKSATVITGVAYLCPRCENVHLSESTGYIIDPRGIMVTNYHVAASYAFMKDGNKPKGFVARMADGRTYAVKAVLASSKKNDLAILQLDTHGDVLSVLSLADSVGVGDKIFILGHPKGIHYFFSQGNVNNRYLEEVGEGDQKFFREMITVSADYATGSSGGPVMDIYGNVVGTVANTRMFLHSDINAGVQMVLKNTVPVESLWKLIRK
ncbi:MAG: trypsin-like peptidase domain-containing protein [Chitinophaga sp.]|uniref:S1 family peptidase n=1 Tax=Chitinophaga sp. TaxID=1869181 RepID=UPI001B1E5E89|nr:serine protease [Chitinophaga sp.]MBO9730743.1 trypsin-like peptidase domain-containing protein [Chitinophaga sp.]